MRGEGPDDAREAGFELPAQWSRARIVAMSDVDPFPRERVTATIRRMPRYLRLAWRLGRAPLSVRVRRAAVIAAAGYLASPIDAVPA